MEFVNRTEAGQRLGSRVAGLGYTEPIVVGVLRGGIPVALEVARALDAPLDVAVVRKLGAPAHPEYALGAIAEGGVALLNRTEQRRTGVSDAAMRKVMEAELRELARRGSVYRAECPPRDVTGRTVILVDDGLATGATAVAAARRLKQQGAKRVVLAVPVCSEDSLATSPDESIDEVVCLLAPRNLYSVGAWYDDFSQVEDEVVLECLREARHFGGGDDGGGQSTETEVEVVDGPVRLQGTLLTPEHPRGVVAFAHGSGSSRTSPRNRMVAEVLTRSGFATLLFDLLDPFESANRANVFDIPLLGRRLVAATSMLEGRPELKGLPIGYFGASTGGGAALWAAAELGTRVTAVVSRGGRPDLAGPRLADVQAPTLLIVGGDDPAVIELNREARERMTCPVEIMIVEGASHLFEEPGTLERVADEAAGWFALQMASEVRHARA